MVPFFFLALFSVWNVPLVLANNIDCIGKDLDWYTKVVGETPCRTYERLRQTCNSNFQVGVMNINTPPDYCTDQVGDCCCNSVAFALSMLCLNCQVDNNSQNGIDAGAGAYQMYLAQTNACPVSNKTLPDSIQAAACNQGIKIMDGIYNIFWSTGDWFYTFTRESLEKDINSSGGKVFSRCPALNTGTQASTAPITSPSTSTQPSSPTPPATSTTSGTTSNSLTNSGSSGSSGSSVSGTGTSTSTIPAFTPPNVAGQTTSTPGGPSSLSDSNQSNNNSNATPTTNGGLSSGAIAGIAVGVVVALLIIALAAFFCYKKKRNQEVMLSPFENFAPRPMSGYQPASQGGVAYQGATAYYPVAPSSQAWSSQAPSSERSGPRYYGHARQASASDIAPTSSNGQSGAASGKNTYQSSSERHTDAGPVRLPSGRPPSGRLPPAYNQEWEEEA